MAKKKKQALTIVGDGDSVGKAMEILCRIGKLRYIVTCGFNSNSFGRCDYQQQHKKQKEAQIRTEEERNESYISL